MTKHTKWGSNLLNIDINAKTVKGQKHGFLTGVLYLAPSTLSGHQVCPFAKVAKCEAGCLNTAGRGAFNNVQSARIAKTKALMQNHDAFMLDLVASIQKLRKQAAKRGLTPAVRLNGTSDIAFERLSVVVDGVVFAHIFDVFPTVQFYDYTKRTDRSPSTMPSNYHLTYSISGAYVQGFIKAHRMGYRNFAAVVRSDRELDMVMGLPVTDGDAHDLRFTDKPNTVAVLKPKGRLRSDTSGFVIEA